jgi:hypothetical protein
MFKLYNIVWHAVSQKLRACVPAKSRIQVGFARTRYHGWCVCVWGGGCMCVYVCMCVCVYIRYLPTKFLCTGY